MSKDGMIRVKISNIDWGMDDCYMPSEMTFDNVEFDDDEPDLFLDEVMNRIQQATGVRPNWFFHEIVEYDDK